MQTPGYSRAPVGVAVLAGIFLLTSCATTDRPQQFRTFLLPPQIVPPAAAEDLVPEPPLLGANAYANEIPEIVSSFPDVTRPSDADFLLKKSEDRFLAGKLALQEGRKDDARREFNQAVEVLLNAPDNAPDRARIERRLEDLIETIYRYDLDQVSAAEPDDNKVSYDKAPLDGILEMTFPVDPSLRNKVKEQVDATVSQLPLEHSDAVVGAINFFSTERGKKIVAAGLRRSARYKPLIERVLAEEGLPQELIFVAQEESGFLPRALSNKACVGMWQFGKYTGQEYGLLQTSLTDDRMDPEKATRAAARHLHDLYEHFGDWYLALAAYDCGPGCVDHAVARTGYADFWTLRRLNVLPQETANYVPVILAMTIMAKNAKDYGLDNIELDRPVEIDTIELQTPTHLGLIADAVERPLSELKDLNPALLRSVAPTGYALHVPKGTLTALETAFTVVPPNRRDSWRLHRVQSGDTFAGLAKRYSAQTAASVSLANHSEIPGEGEWMAIPVAYPGDRAARPIAAHRKASPASAKSKTPAASATRKSIPNSTRNSGVNSTRTSGPNAARKKSTTVAHKNAAKAPAHS
jgi:membrane-bound lytic murein transglycosylase D